MRLARYARKLAFVASVCALAELPGSGGSKPSALGSERAASNRQGALQIAFELASDFDSGVARIRENLLALVDERGAVSDQEVVFTHAAFKTPADDHFRSLSPAEATEVYAYIRALRSSYGRFQGAQTEGDSDWAAKQLKAAQEYADLLANSLIAEAQHDEEDVAQLRKMPFAVRRSPRDQAAFVQRLKNNGLPPEQLALMRESCTRSLTQTPVRALRQAVKNSRSGTRTISKRQLISSFVGCPFLRAGSWLL